MRGALPKAALHSLDPRPRLPPPPWPEPAPRACFASLPPPPPQLRRPIPTLQHQPSCHNRLAEPLPLALLAPTHPKGFADVEESSFYLQLPDLRAVLPAMLFEAGRAAPTEDATDTTGFDATLARLPACASRADIDELASELCIRGGGREGGRFELRQPGRQGQEGWWGGCEGPEWNGR